MRTQLIGLLFLGLTSLTQAQTELDSDAEPFNVNLKDVVISSNARYMLKVYDKNTPEIVKNLEQMVASYNIKESAVYHSDFDHYEVSFKTKPSIKINAVYDSDGIILSSYEQYKDLELPYSIRRAVGKDYEGWAVKGTTFILRYDHQRDLKKVYKIQVSKDGEKKKLKINVEGNMAIVSVDYE